MAPLTSRRGVRYSDLMETALTADPPEAGIPGRPELASRPWRRYLRFSVRGLMALVLVIGGWMGWIARSARIQREAVAAIREAGGQVSYRTALEGGSRRWKWLVTHLGIDYLDDVTWRKWLVGHLGIDYCDDVGGVFFWRSSCTDAEMVHVGRLSGLIGLTLHDSAVTDAGLMHLNGLTSLRRFTLGSCRVSDAGLEHLSQLTSLIDLDLSGTEVTDAGLVHLQGLTNLQRIDLLKTKVTDAGLAHLKALPNLRFILLDGTRVTDAGQNELKQASPRPNFVR
jgi:internalin A